MSGSFAVSKPPTISTDGRRRSQASVIGQNVCQEAHQPTTASHLHVCGLTIFEGPPPAIQDFLDHIRGRLHLVPRYRQKLAVPPLETGRPLWVDDANFNLEYHVRHTALPEPGTEEQLLRLAARIFKTHHALIDGIAGVDLATVLFDLEPVPKPNAPEADEEWVAAREPSGVEMVAAGLRGIVKAGVDVAARA